MAINGRTDGQANGWTGEWLAGWLAEVQPLQCGCNLGPGPHRWERGSMIGSACSDMAPWRSLFPRCPSHLPRAPTLEASVRMSLSPSPDTARARSRRSQLPFSLFLSLSNSQYQALAMMSPEDISGQGRTALANNPSGPAAGAMFPAGTQHRPLRGQACSPILWTLRPRLFFRTDLHQPNLQGTRATIKGSLGSIRVRATCLVPASAPFLGTSLLLQSWKNNSITGRRGQHPPLLKNLVMSLQGNGQLFRAQTGSSQRCIPQAIT